MTAHSSLITDYLGYGTHAARPATPNVGSGVTVVYYETDTGNTFAWTGSGWAQLNGSGGSSLPYSLFQARLSLTSGTPVTITDVTGATTVYLTPYKGGQIGLYTSGVWEVVTFTEKSLSLSGLLKGVCYDIFVYDNSGTITLEALAWKKVTSGSSPTSGASKTLNLTDTATLAVGMNVTIKDGSNSEVANITAVVASTSITVASLTNSYTTPDVYGYLARATALTTQDGVYVKTGAADRRYAGTICITGTAGQCEDSLARRLVWNYYNRIARRLFKTDATSHAYTSGTIRAWNNSNSNRVEFVLGVQEDSLEVGSSSDMQGGAEIFVYLSMDAVAGGYLDAQNIVISNGNYSTNPTRNYGRASHQPGIGYHYYQQNEQGGTTGTFNAHAIDATIQG